MLILWQDVTRVNVNRRQMNIMAKTKTLMTMYSLLPYVSASR